MVEAKMHVGLARSIAARVYRWMGGAVDLDELVSHALLGLGEAASRYRPDAETPFGLFAQYRIRGAILDWLRSMGYLQRRRPPRPLPPPDNGNEAAAPVVANDNTAVAPAPRSGPAPAPIARPALPRPRVRYLATRTGDDDDDCVLSIRSPEPPADALLAEEHVRSLLAAAMRRLPARDRRFLRKHYFEDKTLTQSGAELGLSRYQSCRLHARALARLRELLAAEGFTRLEDV
jgi:RNA polymerase sigma factor for flagellar operon FliA